MKTVCIVTATRAEYGILKPLIRRLFADARWNTKLVVTGTHLDEAFGYTVREIEADGFAIDRRIPIAESGDDGYAVSRMMANALVGFGAYFKETKPDLLILLGDRTEQLAIASAAMNERIAIAHLHGGELTQGAVDECVRHALTKMSYLHFAAAEVYRRRIIQMGESPKRVYNVGALGVENIQSEPLLSEQELEEQVHLPARRPYAVVTFHPVTLEADSAQAQAEELLAAMAGRQDLFFLITKANADAGGRRLNAFLEQQTRNYSNMMLVSSLGMKRYLSAVRYARFVLGNSSSGVIEAPALHVPTVNIGDRQQGRLMADSVISCAPERGAILSAMDQAMEMKAQIEAGERICGNPYGDGHTSRRIVEILAEHLAQPIDLKKKFYDWNEVQL